MRIARILTRLNLGGPARQVLASDPILARRGHELRILAGSGEEGEGDLTDALRARGLDVVHVPGLARGLAPGRDWRALRRLRRELRSFRPDVAHTHASKAGFLGRHALGRRGGGGPALVHTFHGHVLEGYFSPAVSGWLVRAERGLARRTDRIVAVSHATADDLVRLGVADETRLVVVPPGIDLDPLLALPRGRARAAGELRRALGAGADDVLVGVVGRLAEVKRPVRALEAFLACAGRSPGLRLVFVGDGPERSALEERLGTVEPALRARVRLHGPAADMAPILADLDAVLLASRTEGLPVALIEAAAAGLPVVAAAVGGVPELVAHERTGYLAEGDAELVYGLEKLLADVDERLAMGERARLRVARRHSAQALADRLESLYETVLAERRDPAEARP